MTFSDSTPAPSVSIHTQCTPVPTTKRVRLGQQQADTPPDADVEPKPLASSMSCSHNWPYQPSAPSALHKGRPTYPGPCVQREDSSDVGSPSLCSLQFDTLDRCATKNASSVQLDEAPIHGAAWFKLGKKKKKRNNQSDDGMSQAPSMADSALAFADDEPPTRAHSPKFGAVSSLRTSVHGVPSDAGHSESTRPNQSSDKSKYLSVNAVLARPRAASDDRVAAAPQRPVSEPCSEGEGDAISMEALSQPPEWAPTEVDASEYTASIHPGSSPEPKRKKKKGFMQRLFGTSAKSTKQPATLSAANLASFDRAASSVGGGEPILSPPETPQQRLERLREETREDLLHALSRVQQAFVARHVAAGKEAPGRRPALTDAVVSVLMSEQGLYNLDGINWGDVDPDMQAEVLGLAYTLNKMRSLVHALYDHEAFRKAMRDLEDAQAAQVETWVSDERELGKMIAGRTLLGRLHARIEEAETVHRKEIYEKMQLLTAEIQDLRDRIRRSVNNAFLLYARNALVASTRPAGVLDDFDEDIFQSPRNPFILPHHLQEAIRFAVLPEHSYGDRAVPADVHDPAEKRERLLETAELVLRKSIRPPPGGGTAVGDGFALLTSQSQLGTLERKLDGRWGSYKLFERWLQEASRWQWLDLEAQRALAQRKAAVEEMAKQKANEFLEVLDRRISQLWAGRSAEVRAIATSQLADILAEAVSQKHPLFTTPEAVELERARMAHEDLRSHLDRFVQTAAGREIMKRKWPPPTLLLKRPEDLDALIDDCKQLRYRLARDATLLETITVQQKFAQMREKINTVTGDLKSMETETDKRQKAEEKTRQQLNAKYEEIIAKLAKEKERQTSVKAAQEEVETFRQQVKTLEERYKEAVQKTKDLEEERRAAKVARREEEAQAARLERHLKEEEKRHTRLMGEIEHYKTRSVKSSYAGLGGWFQRPRARSIVSTELVSEEGVLELPKSPRPASSVAREEEEEEEERLSYISEGAASLAVPSHARPKKRSLMSKFKRAIGSGKPTEKPATEPPAPLRKAQSAVESPRRETLQDQQRAGTNQRTRVNVLMPAEFETVELTDSLLLPSENEVLPAAPSLFVRRHPPNPPSAAAVVPALPKVAFPEMAAEKTTSVFDRMPGTATTREPTPLAEPRTALPPPSHPPSEPVPQSFVEPQKETAEEETAAVIHQPPEPLPPPRLPPPKPAIGHKEEAVPSGTAEKEFVSFAAQISAGIVPTITISSPRTPREEEKKEVKTTQPAASVSQAFPRDDHAAPPVARQYAPAPLIPHIDIRQQAPSAAVQKDQEAQRDVVQQGKPRDWRLPTTPAEFPAGGESLQPSAPTVADIRSEVSYEESIPEDVLSEAGSIPPETQRRKKESSWTRYIKRAITPGSRTRGSGDVTEGESRHMSDAKPIAPSPLRGRSMSEGSFVSDITGEKEEEDQEEAAVPPPEAKHGKRRRSLFQKMVGGALRGAAGKGSSTSRVEKRASESTTMMEHHSQDPDPPAALGRSAPLNGVSSLQHSMEETRVLERRSKRDSDVSVMDVLPIRKTQEDELPRPTGRDHAREPPVLSEEMRMDSGSLVPEQGQGTSESAAALATDPRRHAGVSSSLQSSTMVEDPRRSPRFGYPSTIDADSDTGNVPDGLSLLHSSHHTTPQSSGESAVGPYKINIIPAVDDQHHEQLPYSPRTKRSIARKVVSQRRDSQGFILPDHILYATLLSRSLTLMEAKRVAAHFATVNAPPGQVLYTEGDPVETLRLVQTGLVDVQHPITRETIEQLGEGAIVLDREYLHGEVSPVRVVSAGAILVEMPRDTFVRATREGQERVAAAILRALTEAPELRTRLTREAAEALASAASAASLRYYQPGETIIVEGDHGTTFYVLLDGTCVAVRSMEARTEHYVSRTVFGLEALHGAAYKETVTAGSPDGACVALVSTNAIDDVLYTEGRLQRQTTDQTQDEDAEDATVSEEEEEAPTTGPQPASSALHAQVKKKKRKGVKRAVTKNLSKLFFSQKSITRSRRSKDSAASGTTSSSLYRKASSPPGGRSL